ncbi:MAG: hypothetical protein CVV48_09925 [Spirochaetae bacterium HGW-Spirochaetae-4]|nr:MAG: hypothetical protein CVV48_09925 [Spirochaetae bacterium HGW-Spirochaetae-4]
MECCSSDRYTRQIPRILVGLPISLLLSILVTGVGGIDIGFSRIMAVALVLWSFGSLVLILNHSHGPTCVVEVLVALCLLFAACTQMALLGRRSQPHFGFPPHRVVHVVGTTRFDSTSTEKGNCVLQGTIDSVGNRFGDMVSATGPLVVIGPTCTMVTAGTKYDAYGVLVRTDTNDWLFIASHLGFDHPSGLIHRLSVRRMHVLHLLSLRLDALGGPVAPLAKALLLGDAGMQGFPLRKMAIGSGCAHILALSGMHLHCLVLIMLFCGNKVLGKRIAQPLACIGAVVYVCIVGFKPSLVRAMVLLCLRSLRNRFPILQLLAITFLVQVFAFPWTMNSTGALLSYCALFAIIVCSTPIAGTLSLCMPKWLALVMGTTIAASLCTAPISLIVFGSWHGIGIVLSPLAAPLALVVLFCSLVWVVLPLPPIGIIAVQSTRAFLYLMEWGSEWSANHFSGDGISVWLWSTAVLLTATGILKYAGQTLRKRNRRAYDLGFSLRFAKRDHRIA